MSDVFKTIFVKAQDQVAAQNTAAKVPGGEGMFTTPLADKSNPSVITYYGSSGTMPSEILDLLWPSSAIISDKGPQEAMADAGLVMWQDPNGI